MCATGEMDVRTVVSVRRYRKAGYEVRRELVVCEPGGEPLEMRTAYTRGGHYIGDPRVAHRLCVMRGIRPETLPGHSVCSIGFSAREQKWYGWSHRAICGFSIGDVVDSEDHCCANSGYIDEYLAEHPEEDHRLPVGFVARDLDDCKTMAIAFAESVG